MSGRPPPKPIARPTPLRGADADRVVALLVELQGDVAKALTSVKNPDRTIADVHYWLREVAATCGRLEQLRPRLPQPDGPGGLG